MCVWGGGSVCVGVCGSGVCVSVSVYVSVSVSICVSVCEYVRECVYMCECMCLCLCVCTWVLRDQKTASDPLQLELQGIVNHQVSWKPNSGLLN